MKASAWLPQPYMNLSNSSRHALTPCLDPPSPDTPSSSSVSNSSSTKMPSAAPQVSARDTYTQTSTSIEIKCPDDVTGLERIMLVAQGDLQRLLSAFFARTITIECIYTKTSPRGLGASCDHPIRQERQVHLKCGTRVVCVATSSVSITSCEPERLLLDEKFALGQIFRHMRAFPQFTLLDCDAQIVNGKRELRRTYRLETEGIMCEILEVFPDRDMFDMGEAWLSTK